MTRARYRVSIISAVLALAAGVCIALLCVSDISGQGVQPGQQVNPVQVNPAGNPLTLQTAWTQTATGAATATTVTQAASAGKTNYCTGFEITGLGATGASGIAVTLSSGGTTIANYTFAVPAGVTVGCTPLVVTFNPPLVGLAAGQNMILTVPSFGAGNTAASVTMHGFTQ